MLLTRNILYTGITRARELLILLGNNKTIEYMINNVDSKKRNTGLRYKLENLLKKNGWADIFVRSSFLKNNNEKFEIYIKLCYNCWRNKKRRYYDF